MITLSILDENMNVIRIIAHKVSNVPNTFGARLEGTNVLFLGEDRYYEWDSIAGNSSAQRKFLDKLTVVTKDLQLNA